MCFTPYPSACIPPHTTPTHPLTSPFPFSVACLYFPRSTHLVSPRCIPLNGTDNARTEGARKDSVLHKKGGGGRGAVGERFLLILFPSLFYSKEGDCYDCSFFPFIFLPFSPHTPPHPTPPPASHPYLKKINTPNSLPSENFFFLSFSLSLSLSTPPPFPRPLAADRPSRDPMLRVSASLVTPKRCHHTPPLSHPTPHLHTSKKPQGEKQKKKKKPEIKRTKIKKMS